MGRIIREILQLLRVRLEIEELLKGRLLSVIAGVDPAGTAHAVAGRDVRVGEAVLHQERSRLMRAGAIEEGARLAPPYPFGGSTPASSSSVGATSTFSAVEVTTAPRLPSGALGSMRINGTRMDSS